MKKFVSKKKREKVAKKAAKAAKKAKAEEEAVAAAALDREARATSTTEHGSEFMDYGGWDVTRQTSFGLNLARQSSFLKRRPFAHSACNLEQLRERLDTKGGQFAWALSFDPQFLAQLARHGFLPMAGQIFSNLICLLPKLHKERCILDFNNLHIPRSVRKKSRKFNLSVDQDIEGVIRGCQVQHGEGCWFYRPLTQSYRRLHREAIEGVRIHSIEIWKDGALVGGELGYVAGGCYTSLSGFRTADGAGTIQCYALARLLEAQGFAFWDLGMPMDYKEGLGAKKIPRKVFLARLQSASAQSPRLELSEPTDCRSVIDGKVK